MKRGRKRKPKPVTLAIGYDGQFRPTVAIVQDPYEPMKTLAVPANGAGVLYSGRKWLSLQQFQVALRFQNLVELAGERGAPAMDWTRDRVDVSAVDRSMSDVKLAALKTLAEARYTLGQEDYRLLRWFASDEAARPSTGKLHDAHYRRRRIRDALDVLAALWGYGRARARMLKRQRERA